MDADSAHSESTVPNESQYDLALSHCRLVDANLWRFGVRVFLPCGPCYINANCWLVGLVFSASKRCRSPVREISLLILAWLPFAAFKTSPTSKITVIAMKKKFDEIWASSCSQWTITFFTSEFWWRPKTITRTLNKSSYPFTHKSELSLWFPHRAFWSHPITHPPTFIQMTVATHGATISHAFSIAQSWWPTWCHLGDPQEIFE